MPTIAFIGAAITKALRHPVVRQALVAILAAGAQYVIKRLKRRPTAS